MRLLQLNVQLYMNMTQSIIENKLNHLELLLGLKGVDKGAERVLGFPGDLTARILSMHWIAVTQLPAQVPARLAKPATRCNGAPLIEMRSDALQH